MTMHDSSSSDPRSSGPSSFPPQEQEATGDESKMTPAPDYGATSYVGHGRLKDCVALITGGDSGIGRAVALAYAREGADVAIAYLESHQDAEKTRDLVMKEGRRAELYPGDIGDPNHCKQLISQIVKSFGHLNIVVNNAAYQGKAVESVTEIDPERLERTFRTNIMAMFHIVREAVPHLSAGSSIINVSSIQATNPTPSIIDYASTKGAITNFTLALAEELGPKGIRVNAIAPGPIWTPLIVQSFPAEKVKSFGSDTPLGRAGQPADLAPAFVFLASDDARFVSGAVLGVTGGKAL